MLSTFSCYNTKNNRMGCPCANPPGKGGRKPVPRDPITMQPAKQSVPLSRNDIRAGRIRTDKVAKLTHVQDDVQEMQHVDAGVDLSDSHAKGDASELANYGPDVQNVSGESNRAKHRKKTTMGGFLSAYNRVRRRR